VITEKVQVLFMFGMTDKMLVVMLYLDHHWQQEEKEQEDCCYGAGIFPHGAKLGTKIIMKKYKQGKRGNVLVF